MHFFARFTATAVFALGFVPLLVSSALAADAAALAAAIQSQYGKMQAFEAVFEQTLHHKESGAVEKRAGILRFKKPLLISWQTSKPQEERLIVTSDVIWEYLPQEEVAYRYPRSLVDNSAGIIRIITGQAALTKDFEVKSAGREAQMDKLQVYPLEPTTQLVEAMLWLDDNHHIRKVKIVDFYGNTNEMHFTSFKPDAPLKAQDFQFTPPAGVDVEDRTADSQPSIFR